MTNIKKIAINVLATQALKEVERLLKTILKGTQFAGKTFAVGGYPRDQLMGLEPKDLDIVVEMREGAKNVTHYIKDLFGSAISTPRQMGASYPIWEIVFKDNVTYQNEEYKTAGAEIQFVDTQKESFPDEGSRQRVTEYGALNEDIERRDFTINMLLKDLSSGEIIDLTGVSKADLSKGILRGHPNVSLDKIFSDDPLRMIRLVRFQAKYGWTVPKSVLRTVQRNAPRIQIVSAERITEELKKVMEVGKLERAIRLMKATGLLKYIFPEVEQMLGVTQGPDHHREGDVFRHSIMVLRNAPKTIEGQLAALLHDVGKPASKKVLGDKIQFLGHEDAGAEIAKAILYRMKFDAKLIDTVTTMIKEHMRPMQLGPDPSDKAIRKFIREVGDELLDQIVELAQADALGSIPIDNFIPGLKQRIKEVRESPIKVVKQPVLNGNEIMKLLGVKPGPIIGEVGKFLLELQDDYASQGKELTKEDAQKAVIEKFKKAAIISNVL